MIVIARENPRTPDVARLIRDLDKMFHELYPAESNHLVDIETLAKPDIHFFVARRDGEAIGTGALWHRACDYGEVKRIYVKPEARGLKLGRRILEKIEENAREHGFATIKLETGIHQPEALGLFAAQGFVKCGAFADYPAEDPNSVFFEKRL